jgi:hypothetical protein
MQAWLVHSSLLNQSSKNQIKFSMNNFRFSHHFDLKISKKQKWIKLLWPACCVLNNNII